MEHTIAAISTSTMSSGGISIVRLSGVDAVEEIKGCQKPHNTLWCYKRW